MVLAGGVDAAEDGDLLGIEIPMEPDSHAARMTVLVEHFIKPLVMDGEPLLAPEATHSLRLDGDFQAAKTEASRQEWAASGRIPARPSQCCSLPRQPAGGPHRRWLARGAPGPPLGRTHDPQWPARPFQGAPLQKSPTKADTSAWH